MAATVGPQVPGNNGLGVHNSSINTNRQEFNRVATIFQTLASEYKERDKTVAVPIAPDQVRQVNPELMADMWHIFSLARGVLKKQKNISEEEANSLLTNITLLQDRASENYKISNERYPRAIRDLDNYWRSNIQEISATIVHRTNINPARSNDVSAVSEVTTASECTSIQALTKERNKNLEEFKNTQTFLKRMRTAAPYVIAGVGVASAAAIILVLTTFTLPVAAMFLIGFLGGLFSTFMTVGGCVLWIDPDGFLPEVAVRLVELYKKFELSQDAVRDLELMPELVQYLSLEGNKDIDNVDILLKKISHFKQTKIAYEQVESKILEAINKMDRSLVAGREGRKVSDEEYAERKILINKAFKELFEKQDKLAMYSSAEEKPETERLKVIENYFHKVIDDSYYSDINPLYREIPTMNADKLKQTITGSLAESKE